MDGQDRSVPIPVTELTVRWLEIKRPRSANDCRRKNRLVVVAAATSGQQISFSVIPSEVEESLNISAFAEREEPEISRDVSTAVDMTAERFAKNQPEYPPLM